MTTRLSFGLLQEQRNQRSISWGSNKALPIVNNNKNTIDYEINVERKGAGL
jgi:hypothetical protein